MDALFADFDALTRHIKAYAKGGLHGYRRSVRRRLQSRCDEACNIIGQSFAEQRAIHYIADPNPLHWPGLYWLEKVCDCLTCGKVDNGPYCKNCKMI